MIIFIISSTYCTVSVSSSLTDTLDPSVKCFIWSSSCSAAVCCSALQVQSDLYRTHSELQPGVCHTGIRNDFKQQLKLIHFYFLVTEATKTQEEELIFRKYLVYLTTLRWSVAEWESVKLNKFLSLLSSDPSVFFLFPSWIYAAVSVIDFTEEAGVYYSHSELHSDIHQ